METLTTSDWSLIRKGLFRFFFIYLLLQTVPWFLLYPVPGPGLILEYYNQLIDGLVQAANANLFHIRKVLVAESGSGDTSWGWAQQWLFVCIAFAGCLIWSFLDRKRNNYVELNYWLCLIVRYYLIGTAFRYGIEKLFVLQMPFPNQSQLSTPLGDLLPMRLSWMFLGYSATYQFFAGLMEVLVGALLLYRKTVTLGALLAVAVFSNVMLLNLSYDIPVKIFSMNLVLFSLFLLANEYNRIFCFFVLNKPAEICSIYHFKYPKKWMRYTRIILKVAFIINAVGFTFHECWQGYKWLSNLPETRPIKSGVYDVAVFAVNKDTLPALITDTMRWADMIFEKNGSGSIKTSDTTFRQRYKRGYFRFESDTLNQVINFKKLPTDSATFSGIILSMHYQILDSNTIQLWGKQKTDSLYVLLKRSNRHFQLAEKQFHWLSEYNR